MTSSELHRKLLFCGYDELTDFLKNSPTNRYIYKLLVAADQKVPPLALFNEIYYQCVRVQSDGNPGEDVSRRYIDEGCEWLGDEDATMLVFCIVLALIEMKVHPMENEKCFMQRLMPCVEGHRYMSAYNDLIGYMTANNLKSPYEFKPKPCPIDEIPVHIDLKYNLSLSKWDKVKARLNMPVESSAIDFNPWCKVTDDFSPNTILWYIKLYKTREDQLRLLERITKACTPDEFRANEHYFTEMERYIRMGNTVNRSLSYRHFVHDYVVAEPDEGFKYNEPDRSWNSYKWEYERISKELETTKLQCEEQCKAHEMELARLEAQYKSEIVDLKTRLKAQPAVEETPTDREAEPTAHEFTLTLTELVDYMKERFSEASANEVITMLLRMSIKKSNMNDEEFKLIDSIIPAILQRDAPRQTYNINDPGHVYINPEKVENKYNKE